MIMNDVWSLGFTQKMLENGYHLWGISVDAEIKTPPFLLTMLRIYFSFDSTPNT